MIFSKELNKSIFISLLGHLAVFSVFNISFGGKLVKADYGSIDFRGAIFTRLELLNSLQQKVYIENLNPPAGSRKSNSSIVPWPADNYKAAMDSLRISEFNKPRVQVVFNKEKMIYAGLNKPPEFLKHKPAIMFYPRLPYYFNLYFKDRQIAHIELLFNILPKDSTDAVIIKRKISSGNLEADLLSIRYISQYLFMQKTRFIPNIWQTVKIELSNND